MEVSTISEKKKFYEITQEIKKSGIDLDKDGWWVKKAVLAVLHKRRIGKSTSSLNLIERMWEHFNYTRKLLYIRNTEEELKTFRNSFNVKFAGRFRIVNNHIYKITVDENGKENIHSRKIIGICGAVSTYEKIKSLIDGTDFYLVLWDEFNGYDDNKDFQTHIDRTQYFYLLELIASVEGPSEDMLVLLLGNKVNSQNDILLNWNITIPYEPNDYDLWEERDVKMDGSLFKIRFCNGGREEWAEVGLGNHLFKALATFNRKANDYFVNNDFYQKQDRTIVAANVIKNREVLYYITVKNIKIEFGRWDKGYYFDEAEVEADEGYASKRVFGFDIEGFLNFKSAQDTSREEWAEFLTDVSNKIKNEECYFTSNWLKFNIINFIQMEVKYGLI